MTHLHSIYDIDQHFIIDPITRKMTNDSGKVVLMQTDHNSERFTFELPRYIDGHDMSLTDKVEIHFLNLETALPKRKASSIYPVQDLQVSPDAEDVVIFSWLISGASTQYAGTLTFMVRFVCYDETNPTEIVYQYWTDMFKQITIMSTTNNSGSIASVDTNDLLEAWRLDCIQAVFESEVFDTLEAQGSSYVEQAKAYAEQAKELSGLNTVQSLVTDIQTTGAATLDGVGWYRIAEYSSDKESSAYGAGSNMCDLVIKRGYSSTQSEYHVIRFRSVYKKQEFVSLDDSSVGHLITKVRHVVDTSNYKSYIEVYYNADAANGFYCLVQSGKDRNRLWTAMTPKFVNESTEGVTVTTTYNVPANSVPMNSTNMKETGIASAAYKLNWKIKGGNKEGITYIKLCSRTITGTYQFADATFLLAQPYAGTYYNAIVNARAYMGKSSFTVNLTQTSGLDISDRLFYEQISDTEAGTETINFYLQLNHYETVYGYIIGAANMDIPSDFPELTSINYTGTGTYQAVAKAVDADTVNGLHAEEVGASGVRNLIPYPYWNISPITNNDVTFTANADGSITAKGVTTSSYSYFRLAHEQSFFLRKGTYTASINADGNKNVGMQLSYYNADGTQTNLATVYDKRTVELPMDAYVSIFVTYKIPDGAEYTIYPMLEVGKVAHDYMPYHFGGAKDADTVDGWNFYSSLSELGLTEATATAESIVNAMPDNSMLLHKLGGSATSAPIAFPYNYSTLKVIKLSSSYVVFECIGTGDSLIQYSYYNGGSSNKWSGWSTRFLPHIGGTLSGDLYIKKLNYPSEVRVINYNGEAFFRNFVDDNNYKEVSLMADGSLMHRVKTNGITKTSTVLHTGNSAKVTISDTAPTDGLWVVP